MCLMDDLARLAKMLKALGDPTRLRIFGYLRCCEAGVSIGDDGGISPAEGPTAGQVCCYVTGEAKVTSTLSHHLKELREAGLITMERRGQRMICRVQPDAVPFLSKLISPPCDSSSTISLSPSKARKEKSRT